MRPSLPGFDARNGALSYLESFGQNDLLLGRSADVLDVSFGKSGIPMINAGRAAPFGCTISVVIAARAYGEMIWVYAGGIVAGMHKNFVTRYSAFGKRIGVAMGADWKFAGQEKYAIASVVFGSHPEPTAICFVDARPEGIFGSQDFESFKGAGSFFSVVAASAQFARHYWLSFAKKAFKIGSVTSVTHSKSSYSRGYAISMEASTAF